jgi:hypothetical protein
MASLFVRLGRSAYVCRPLHKGSSDSDCSVPGLALPRRTGFDTPVSAQADGVLLRGSVDKSGAVLAFPKAPSIPDYSRPRLTGSQIPMRPRTAYPLPVDQ